MNSARTLDRNAMLMSMAALLASYQWRWLKGQRWSPPQVCALESRPPINSLLSLLLLTAQSSLSFRALLHLCFGILLSFVSSQSIRFIAFAVLTTSLYSAISSSHSLYKSRPNHDQGSYIPGSSEVLHDSSYRKPIISRSLTSKGFDAKLAHRIKGNI